MSTYRKELEALRDKVRANGHVCTFRYDAEGWIDAVYFKGHWYGPIGFAEAARPLRWVHDGPYNPYPPDVPITLATHRCFTCHAPATHVTKTITPAGYHAFQCADHAIAAPLWGRDPGWRSVYVRTDSAEGLAILSTISKETPPCNA